MVESQAQPHRVFTPGSLIRSAFVGRQRELGELKTALEHALSGLGRLVMVVGEPGIYRTWSHRRFLSPNRHASDFSTLVQAS